MSQGSKRRLPLQVGLFYGASALLLVLLAQMVLPVAGAPEWSVELVAATLFIPFPFVVILAWALTARPLEDVRRTRPRRELTGGPPRD